MSSTPTLLTSTNVKQFLNSFDNFIFDCDGVLWRGDHLIEGADKAIELLSKEVGKYKFRLINA
jgi:4-nitrophenyl phosphatase